MSRLRRAIYFGFIPAIALTAMVGLSSPAYADTDCASGHFCAWEHSNYGGQKLLDSTAAGGTGNVDVANDRVSSVKNLTGNRWCGVNNGFPGDDTILNVAQNTRLGYVGNTANDKIDHFYVRAGNTSCS